VGDKTSSLLEIMKAQQRNKKRAEDGRGLAKSLSGLSSGNFFARALCDPW
jgi:hypothetical protein